MNWPEMHQRCPSAKFVCIASLADHHLKFTRRSKNRGCGVADAVYEEGATVWGVVYEILDTEIGILDKCEGFNPGRELNAYVREERHVCRDGDKEKPLLVSVYFVNNKENCHLPDEKYKRLIVEGAEYWHLPTEYIEQLCRIKVVAQPMTC